MLIIDEHPAVRHALSARLSSAPHIEVLAEASNLEEGAAHVDNLRPEVILLEPKVKSKERYHSLKIIISQIARRRLKNGRPTGIIVLTSYADELEVEEALQAGAQRYLLKDIDSCRLITEIENVAAEVRAYR